MRTVYYLVWNHKYYVTTDLVEMLAFEDFMGCIGQSKSISNMLMYVPRIEKFSTL